MIEPGGSAGRRWRNGGVVLAQRAARPCPTLPVRTVDLAVVRRVVLERRRSPCSSRSPTGQHVPCWSLPSMPSTILRGQISPRAAGPRRRTRRCGPSAGRARGSWSASRSRGSRRCPGATSRASSPICSRLWYTRSGSQVPPIDRSIGYDVVLVSVVALPVALIVCGVDAVQRLVPPAPRRNAESRYRRRLAAVHLRGLLGRRHARHQIRRPLGGRVGGVEIDRGGRTGSSSR